VPEPEPELQAAIPRISRLLAFAQVVFVSEHGVGETAADGTLILGRHLRGPGAAAAIGGVQAGGAPCGVVPEAEVATA